MTDDYEQIVSEYAAKRAGLQLAAVPPPRRVDRERISRCANMVGTFIRAGGPEGYKKAMEYSCEAMKAGLTHDACTDMLRDVGQTQFLLCRWYGDAVMERKTSSPREVLDVVDFWAAVEAAYWVPDSAEQSVGRFIPGEYNDALAASRRLRTHPRDAEALATFRRCSGAITERVTRLFDF
jgi:hypothetical protein